MPTRWKARVAHVPHGTPYSVENSRWYLRILVKLGFIWVDLDGHVTFDLVAVCGHWGLIAKNGFLIPQWFKQKYGDRPQIKNVRYADLARLRTKPIVFRGRRTYRFMSLGDAISLAVRLGRRIMYEQKGDLPFREVSFWQGVGNYMVAHGMPESHFVVATLPTMRGAKAVLMAAHAAGRQTMVIRAETGVPRSWEPYMTYYRGRIKWIEGK